MANRYFNQLSKVIGGEKVCVMGSFAPNGVGAISNASNTGRGYSVTRTGVGAYQILFDDAYVELVSATATVQLAAVADLKIVVGAFVQAARTLVLTAVAVAAPTEIAAAANNRVHFCVWFRNSAVP